MNSDRVKKLNEVILQLPSEERKCISDKHHTFQELYDHRIILFIALMKLNPDDCWRSKLHNDGTMFDGSFICGLFKESGKMITYHFPISLWDKTSFAETLEKAPVFDGHTPKDVVDRIEAIFIKDPVEETPNEPVSMESLLL